GRELFNLFPAPGPAIRGGRAYFRSEARLILTPPPLEVAGEREKCAPGAGRGWRVAAPRCAAGDRESAGGIGEGEGGDMSRPRMWGTDERGPAKLSLLLPHALAEDLARACERHGLTRSEVLRRLLEAGLPRLLQAPPGEPQTACGAAEALVGQLA